MTCQEYPQGDGSGGVGRPSRRSSGTSSTFSSSSYSAYSSSTVTTALASLACFSSSWDEFDPRGPSSSPSPSCTLIEDQLVAMLRMERNYTIRRLQCHEVCIATDPPLAAAAAAAVSSPHCKHRRIESAPSPKSVIPSSDDQHPAAPAAASSTTRGGGSHHYRHVSNNDVNRNGSAPPSQQQQQQAQTRTMTNTCSSSSLPHDEWRRKICEWSYKVVDHFKFDREVVSVAMNYFDRYLSIEKEMLLKSRFEQEEQDHDDNDDERKTPTRHASCTCSTCLRPVDSRTFQLAAMTSLYLAIKLHAEMGVDDDDADAEQQYDMNDEDCQNYPHQERPSTTNRHGARRPSQQAQQPFLPRGRRRLRLCAFVELSRGQFSSRDITSMEMTLLNTLRWRVNPPTPAALVTNLLHLLPRHPSPTRFGLFGATNTNAGRHCDGVGAGRNDSIHAYRRDVQMNYDLVVHVLHELSRYLTELSVCLADVSGSCHYGPSDIAYASILVSMDMISTRALPMEMRYEFRRDVARVSSLAIGGGGGDYGGYDDTHGGGSSGFGAVNLVPKEDLKRRIRHSFLPEMLLLDSSSSTNDGVQQQQQPQHPIAVARDAGLLDLSAFYDSAAIAASNAIIDGTNDNNDVGIVQEGQHDDEEEVQYQAGSTSPLSTSSFKERKVSATSVIHGNDETERALKSARRGEGSSSPSRATRKSGARGDQLAAAAAAAAAAATAEEAKAGEALLAAENEDCVSMTRQYCRETVLESTSVTTSSVIGGRAVLSTMTATAEHELSTMTATAEHEQQEHYTSSSRRRRRRRRNGEYSSYGGRDY